MGMFCEQDTYALAAQQVGAIIYSKYVPELCTQYY